MSTGCASVRGERWGTAEPEGLSPPLWWGQGSCPRRAGVPQAVELGGCLDGGRGGKPSSAKNLSQQRGQPFWLWSQHFEGYDMEELSL